MKTNDFVLNVATVNGSGSQSANTILLKTLFRMGIPVGGKNVFPSNIQGLPTWFWIRANEKGYVGRRTEADILVAMNPQTLAEDTKTLKPGGFFVYNSDLVFDSAKHRSDITYVPVPFKKLVDQATDQAKIKKMLINIIYVGVLAELLKLDAEILKTCLADQFGKKQSVVESNTKAFLVGKTWAEENLKSLNFPFVAQALEVKKPRVLMDGNTASALGLMFGGCSFVAWYPITPSSSLVENFQKYASTHRQIQDGKKSFAVVQAEDELSSICMVLGAGWAGARAMTATSGPGVSLMAEAAGYAYYAEIPCVLWDVQRVGPSTGMPTRTAQGDLLEALYLSHGDTKHPILLPANIQECFEFGQTSFDLAERLQQLVLVLSDLDLGMNLWMADAWPYPEKPMDRGKVLTEKELEKNAQFFRYQDVDGDAIAPRTLPGTKHNLASYFTRGSGHNAKGHYTESSPEYKEVVDRLARKWETAKKYVPKPFIDDHKSKVGIIAYGSSDFPMQEARDILNSQGIPTDYLRLKALPFTAELESFIQTHERLYVIDQNRDGQMHMILRTEYPQVAHKMTSLCHYDGNPIAADNIFGPIFEIEKQKGHA